jgi:hypothetical protein
MREFFETLSLILIAAGSAILIVSPIAERFFRASRRAAERVEAEP